MAFKNTLPKKSENLSDWYNSLIFQSELAEHGPAKGTMIFRPYGYAIWELIQQALDVRFKSYGVENAYFPLFIPEPLIHQEKTHLEGFSPELAVVTIGGGEELAEKLVVRPTSETLVGSAFSRWIHSWRDLPMLINQWVNVVRWEKRTYLFMRTSEFLWQEGHTAHVSHQDAIATQEWAMRTYAEVLEKMLALPGYVGPKSPSETFAGAENTLTYEALMPDGKALQSCTSHDLGQNFAKVFNIVFQNQKGKKDFVWQTSWGLSTRTIGALILAHGDDKGLRLPPALAPVQVVVLPINSSKKILEACALVKDKLSQVGIRVKVDPQDETVGFKINKWELKGVPLRIEIGSNELSSGTFKVARRDTGEKLTIVQEGFTEKVVTILQDIQSHMLRNAQDFLRDNTHDVSNYEQFKDTMLSTKGFIDTYWCGDTSCETAIKTETTATIRCKVNGTFPIGTCVYCGNKASEKWYFAQAY